MIVKFGRRPDYNTVEYKVKDYKTAIAVAKEAVANRGMSWNYTRCNLFPKNKTVEIDFGSWSYFILISDFSDKDWQDAFSKTDNK